MRKPLHHGLTFHRIVEAIRNRGWVSLTQLTAVFVNDIPPEVALRYSDFIRQHTGYRGATGKAMAVGILEQIRRGKRELIRRKATDCARSGLIVAEKGSARGKKEPRYRSLPVTTICAPTPCAMVSGGDRATEEPQMNTDEH